MTKMKLSVEMSLEKQVARLRRILNESVKYDSKLLSTQAISVAPFVDTLNSQLQGSSTISAPLTWPAGATYAILFCTTTAILEYDRLVGTDPSIAPVITGNLFNGLNSTTGRTGYFVPVDVVAADINVGSLSFMATVDRKEANMTASISFDSNSAPATFAASNNVTVVVSAFVQYYSGAIPVILP